MSEWGILMWLPVTNRLISSRKEALFVNLIRGVLTKNFKECGSYVNSSPLSQHEKQRDIHTESCYMKPRSTPVENSILKSVYTAQQLIQKNYNTMESLERSDEDKIDAKKVLKDWSAGSTALDCSVMLSFCRISSSCVDSESIYHLKLSEDENLECQDFLVNATIVDLDFKKDSIAHFHKYKKQLNETKMAYKEFMESRSD